MRLRLILERHSLPPVKVVWTVGRVLPPLANAGASYTISQLLEQIDQIIPLQSHRWSLADYVVETGGFECLHFSPIDDALSDGDEVRIRPLQRADLRDRKISGRHQTTADGRLLIDGVTFGRSFTPAEGRPSVDIPPRKKRRIERDKHDKSDTESGGEQMVSRSRSDDGICDRGTIDKGYRLAKVSAEDERLGLVAPDDGRGSSSGSAVATGTTMSVVGDDRPIDDGSESGDPMNIHQLRFGDSDGSGSADEDYGSSGESTVVKNIESSNTIAESSHHLEEQESESAENPSVNFEDDAQYTNSSGGKNSDEEVGIRTNMHDPLIAKLDDDEYSADVEFDPTNESIYESAEDIECGSEDMSVSSGYDSDATNQLAVNHLNIRDLFFADLEADDTSDTDFDPAAESTAESEENMEDSFEGSNGPSDEEFDAITEADLNIRDLFYADLELDHPSDGDFDAAFEKTNDSEEYMDNSGNSNDADSDYTDDPNATAMTLLDLVRKGDIEDRSSDEEFLPADEGADNLREPSQSDKENSEEEIEVPEPDGPAKHRSHSSFLPTPSSHTSVTFTIDGHSTTTVWGPLAPGHL